jgi:hypothetical protein
MQTLLHRKSNPKAYVGDTVVREGVTPISNTATSPVAVTAAAAKHAVEARHNTTVSAIDIIAPLPDGTTYYLYRVSTNFSVGSVNLDGEVTQCKQTIEPYQGEEYYSPSEFGSIQYSSSTYNNETYDVSAKDNKIIVKHTYYGASIRGSDEVEVSTCEITL